MDNLDDLYGIPRQTSVSALLQWIEAKRPRARPLPFYPPAKKGRPKIGEQEKTLKATKPWDAEGMSRSRWYALRRGAR